MNILVIGAGYVGLAAAKAWQAQGHSVTLATRSRQEELSKTGMRIVVTPSGQLQEALKGQQIVLLSMAPDSPDLYSETYLGTAQAVLRDLDKTAEQILYTSSSSVYGEHGGAIVDEATPLKPMSEREHILVDTEKLLQKAPCKVCIFRLGEIVGPGRMIIDRLRRLNGNPLPGTGEAICNLSPIEEIVEALLLASANRWEDIYNLCSDLHIPRRQLYDQLCKEAGIPPIVWDPTRVSPHAGNKTMSNQKIKRVF